MPSDAAALEPAPSPLLVPAPLADALRACGASVLQEGEHEGHGRTVTTTALEPAPSPLLAPAPLADALRACDASVL